MIEVFYGENRLAAVEAAKKWLGEGYEVVEGAELSAMDLPSLFLGNSLFGGGGERRILVRDILTNTGISEELPKYLKTPHKIALLEMKIDKRTALYKKMSEKSSGVKFLEPFENSEKKNMNEIWGIYRTAKYDGKKAVEMLEKVEAEEDPINFLGALTSQAIKDFVANPGTKEKRVLSELSKLDMQLKAGATLSPWPLISGFLLRLSSL